MLCMLDGRFARHQSGMNELVYRSAVELRQLIQTKQISASELLDAHLAHIESINPKVNAIVTLVPDHARKLAADIDTRITRGEDVGLLGGLPIAHKDLVLTK